jgi:hypothetical protein
MLRKLEKKWCSENIRKDPHPMGNKRASVSCIDNLVIVFARSLQLSSFTLQEDRDGMQNIVLPPQRNCSRMVLLGVFCRNRRIIHGFVIRLLRAPHFEQFGFHQGKKGTQRLAAPTSSLL